MATASAFDFQEVLAFVEPSVYKEVEEYTKKLNLSVDEKNEITKAEDWLDWADKLNYLKSVRESVPDFILPKNCSGELIDVKVFSKRGPDDAIYDRYKAVRDKVARGNTFLNITHGKHTGARCILYGLKKFTGGLGDDDDKDKGDNHTWKRYFTKNLEEASHVIATRKANGEAAHLSCVEIDGQHILCAGSKNVHLLFRNKDDISYYRGPRFRIASEICHSVMDFLNTLEEKRRLLMLKFLATTRMTAIFEILSPDHQHVEDLSHLDKPLLQFITWTLTDLSPSGDNLLGTVPPHIGIELARALGLSTVDYTKIPISDIGSRMKMVRQGYGYEGEVLYFVDGTGQVMGLLKKKTVWYILCRALREKVRFSVRVMTTQKETFSIGKTISKVEKRVLEIQKWLGLSEAATQEWTQLGISFVKWVTHQAECGRIDLDRIGDQFPSIWKQHLEESGLSDKIEVNCEEEEENEEEEQGVGAEGASSSAL